MGQASNFDNKDMTIYLLEWDNGLRYDDHEVTLMGIYTSPERREEGKYRYDSNRKGWPFNAKGNWIDSDLETDDEWQLEKTK